MRSKKLLHDSFYVNSETFSGVTVNRLDDLIDGLWYHYKKSESDWKLSILNNNEVITVPGIIFPTYENILVAPSSLIASTEIEDRIDLTWLNDTEDTTTYIERSDDNINYSLIDITNCGVTYYSDYSVLQSISYYYKVKSYKGNKFSDYSNTTIGTNVNPLPPSGDGITFEGETVLLSFEGETEIITFEN